MKLMRFGTYDLVFRLTEPKQLFSGSVYNHEVYDRFCHSQDRAFSVPGEEIRKLVKNICCLQNWISGQPRQGCISWISVLSEINIFCQFRTWG